MYGKIFGSLFDGSMRGQPNLILVFVNMLCRCNPDGTDDRHARVISDEIGLPLATVKECLVALESPDTESRTPDQDGRRLVRLDFHRDWGWKIVNYDKYQVMRSEIDRREQNRLAQQRHRQHLSAPVSTDKHCQPPSAPVAVAVAVAEAVKKENKARPADMRTLAEYFAELGMPESEAQKFNDFYTSKGWMVGKSPMRDWKAAARNWHKGYKPEAQQPDKFGNTHDSASSDRANANAEKLIAIELRKMGFRPDGSPL